MWKEETRWLRKGYNFILYFSLLKEICASLIKVIKFNKETDDLEKRREEKKL